MESYVSIGQVKRDISELVNRVAYGGGRIVLTSRGRPKAALVGTEDYEQLWALEQKDIFNASGNGLSLSDFRALFWPKEEGNR